MVFSKMADPILETANISNNLIEESIKLEEYNFNLFKSCLMGDIHEIKSLQEGTLLEEEIEEKTEKDNMTFWQKIAAFFKRIKNWLVGNGRKNVADMKNSLDAAIGPLYQNRTAFYNRLNTLRYKTFDLLMLLDEEIPKIDDVFRGATIDTQNKDLEIDHNDLERLHSTLNVHKDSELDRARDEERWIHSAKVVYINKILTGKMNRYKKAVRKDADMSQDEFSKIFLDRYLQKFPGCPAFPSEGGDSKSTMQMSTQFDKIVVNREYDKLLSRLMNDYSIMNKICDTKIAECQQIINTSKHVVVDGNKTQGAFLGMGGRKGGNAELDKMEYLGVKDAITYYTIAMRKLIVTYMNFYIRVFNAVLNSVTTESTYMDLNYQKYLAAMESCTFRI